MEKQLVVPGLAENVHAADVSEVAIKPGDMIKLGDTIATLETDKAAMDLPAELAGKVVKVLIKPGANVKVGEAIAVIEVSDSDPAPAQEDTAAAPDANKAPAALDDSPADAPEDDSPPATPSAEPAQPAAPPSPPPRAAPAAPSGPAHAPPGVRQYARELGVDLDAVAGSARGGRITRDDVHRHVRTMLAGGGTGVALPEIDFSQWGDVETVELSRVRQLTGENLGRSWPRVPQVTQHDQADITDLEAFRRAHLERAKAGGAKLTLVAFLLKVCAGALREFPDFNASLHPGGRTLIRKRYVHIGVAVDTPAGLVVPVLRDVDRQGVLALAATLADLSARARERKLKPDEMRGGCFTISSLGGIGGTAFTPVVNWPEVAILGVSRAFTAPVWRDDGFAPRLVLPLSLSYDHRVIDGAQAARFTRRVAELAQDPRELLL